MIRNKSVIAMVFEIIVKKRLQYGLLVLLTLVIIFESFLTLYSFFADIIPYQSQ
jgi:hypothetical protein